MCGEWTKGLNNLLDQEAKHEIRDTTSSRPTIRKERMSDRTIYPCLAGKTNRIALVLSCWAAAAWSARYKRVEPGPCSSLVQEVACVWDQDQSSIAQRLARPRIPRPVNRHTVSVFVLLLRNSSGDRLWPNHTAQAYLATNESSPWRLTWGLPRTWQRRSDLVGYTCLNCTEEIQ